jgi:hypothetical protein
VLQNHLVAGVSRAWKLNRMFNRSCMAFSHNIVFSEWAQGTYSEFWEFEDQCTYKIFRESWLH